ncbi:hypothetical protein DYB28_008549 [Aphanomyces astaci]|uniref:PDZ domain-containing protein n=1 Tax=Aphanomyces astaci TaxID=112090 RepID=A0A9X8DXB8_APHAT|nr:hypothetical protein DYB28_008549 [Aphanomyces astaci]
MPLMSHVNATPRSHGAVLDASSPTVSTSNISLDMDLLESSTNSVQSGGGPCAQCAARVTTEGNAYEVSLEKDLYGLGIYFAKGGDSAIVDQHVPFYKLPSGREAPGEACGVIKPGDILLSINEEDITSFKFEEVVEALRNLASGRVVLRFRTPNPASPDHESLEVRLRALENDVERERKCRLMTEKKMHMYRDEVLRLTDVNAVLHCTIKSLENDLHAAQKFARYAHVAI